MEQKIIPLHVMGVVITAQEALKNKGFNSAEVMLGLQELVGRLIVDMSSTAVGAKVLIDHSKQHLDDTVRIGMEIKGQSVVPS